jgi:DNA-binding transcriptional LysR family regulator
MHLKVEKNLYVIPGDYLLRTKQSPKTVVEREFRMQLLSALLTGGASLGLAYLYRDACRMFRLFSPNRRCVAPPSPKPCAVGKADLKTPPCAPQAPGCTTHNEKEKT